MSLFLSESEKTAFFSQCEENAGAHTLYWALLNRCDRRAASPGLSGQGTTTNWWHHAAEYLTDAAMAYALKPSAGLSTWIRDVTLSIVRRPVSDWVGPDLLNRSARSPVGHQATAHLSWAVAVVLDLARALFSEDEQNEISAALREKGIALCRRGLDSNNQLSSERCVLNAGIAVAAAVLGDDATLLRVVEEFKRCQQMFLPDGSCGESLQYAGYAAFAQALSWEALVRRNPDLASSLPLEPSALMPRWQAASHFYTKPLSGWGEYPRPRSANFNDSAALFRPSADLLFHIAVRSREKLPQEAGLARWLFDTLYQPYVSQEPDDRSSLGHINDFGFLTVPLLAHASEAVTPEQAGISSVAGFSCGDMIARDEWAGRTVLAVHGAGDSLHDADHLHGDLNSFILVHNQERLLVDPGHSCARNLIHDLESSTCTHNTCTFETDSGIAQQFRQTELPGGERLILARKGSVSVLGSEIAAQYGAPVTEFSRFWILCGTHVLFVVDHVVASEPVKATWNWLLNNRDGQLDLKLLPPDRLVARRGNAGLKLFHLGGGSMSGPMHGYVHDAYHPLPNQQGEGRPGSGLLMRWSETSPIATRTVVHAIAIDDPGSVAGWHIQTDENGTVLESPGATAAWSLKAADGRFVITENVAGLSYEVVKQTDHWQLT